MRRTLLAVGFLAVLMMGLEAPRCGEGGSPFGGVSAVRVARAESPQETGTEGSTARPAIDERRAARSRFRYLAAGYGLIWIALGFYLFRLHGRVAAVGREIEELKGRLEAVKGSRTR